MTSRPRDCHTPDDLALIEPGETKNDSGRTLPYDLLPELRELVDTQWREHEELAAVGVLSPFVFHRRGKRIANFRRAWLTVCEGAGVPGKLGNDFRRTAVRNLVRAGVAEKTAMLLTGRKTRSVFGRYDIVNESNLRAAVGRLGAAAADGAGTKKGQSDRFGRVSRFSRSPK